VAGRHELNLAEWMRIAPLLPARETRRTYYADHRLALNGMLYRHATGCAWRDLPRRYGPWSTVASLRASAGGRWRRERLWGHVLAPPRASWSRRAGSTGSCGASTAATSGRIASLRARGKTGPPRARRPRWGAPAAGSRPSLHLVTDCHGLPLAVPLSAGQAHESGDDAELVRIAARLLGFRRVVSDLQANGLRSIGHMAVFWVAIKVLTLRVISANASYREKFFCNLCA
jgi:transposase